MALNPSILFVDAYDSFAENIASLVQQLLHVRVVLTNIDTDVSKSFDQDISTFINQFDAVILGPGPGTPENANDVGIFNDVWRHAAKDHIPVLGICLGFQSLCLKYGLSVTSLGLPCHGQVKDIYHKNTDIFHDVGKVCGTGYNSLGVQGRQFRPIANNIPSETFQIRRFAPSKGWRSSSNKQQNVPEQAIEVLAWDTDCYVMGVKHISLPFWGLQFHPESCKSNPTCQKIIKRWWGSVQKQNRRHRNNLLSTQTMTHSLKTPVFNRRLDRITGIEIHIKQLISNTGDTVTYKSCRTPSEQGQMENFVHRINVEGETAVLESTKKGRFRIFAVPGPQTFHIEYANGQCTIRKNGQVSIWNDVTSSDMLQLIENMTLSKRARGGVLDIPFWGGFIGYFSYEFERDTLGIDVQPRQKENKIVPEMSLLWADRSIIVDQNNGTATIQSILNNDEDWLQNMTTRLGNLVGEDIIEKGPSNLTEVLSSTTISLPEHDPYVSNIRACQSELFAGNSYELCLTAEAIVKTPIIGEIPCWDLYRNLQTLNPAPFAAYLDFPNVQILSSSPEQFLTWSRTGTVDMVPMKGTVEKSPSITLSKATEILSSPKESAENLMIADLIRHDLYSALGRDAKVEVVKLCEVVEHETVYQLVSHIRGQIPLRSLDPEQIQQEVISYGHKCLRHTLPPGSMTGAPKKRSCEILHRLEQRPRGVYSGVLGYFDVGGGGAWSVCIRTAFSNRQEDNEQDGTQTWRIGAGGAITVLSDPESEWKEMMTKLNSVLRAFRPSGL